MARLETYPSSTSVPIHLTTLQNMRTETFNILKASGKD